MADPVLPTSLLDLLSTSLILRQTAPYLAPYPLLALASTSKAFRHLIITSHEACAYLDLRHVRAATLKLDQTPLDKGGQSFRAERMDESLTEDDFYCGPLRGIFSKLSRPTLNMLRFVQVLVLDGLSVPADMVREIIGDEDRFNVRILSLRGCGHLNERKLCQVLQYAVRPGRREGTPKLKGLYVFGPADSDAPSSEAAGVVGTAGRDTSGVTTTEGAQIGAPAVDRSRAVVVGSSSERWYSPVGRVMPAPIADWAPTMQACSDIIAFDAVLCRGPRHDPAAGKDYLPPRVANVSLGTRGCEICGTCPEGSASFSRDREKALPLLDPPPLHSASVKAAQRPQPLFDQQGSRTYPELVLRCEDCMRQRWCERCNKWWCERCYSEPISRVARAAIVEDGGRDHDAVKVYFNVCVENCLRSEILAVADGMWG